MIVSLSFRLCMFLRKEKESAGDSRLNTGYTLEAKMNTPL